MLDGEWPELIAWAGRKLPFIHPNAPEAGAWRNREVTHPPVPHFISLTTNPQNHRRSRLLDCPWNQAIFHLSPFPLWLPFIPREEFSLLAVCWSTNKSYCKSKLRGKCSYVPPPHPHPPSHPPIISPSPTTPSPHFLLPLKLDHSQHHSPPPHPTTSTPSPSTHTVPHPSPSAISALQFLHRRHRDWHACLL